MSLIIDVETTGLPEVSVLEFDNSTLYKDTNKYNNCRIVQLSNMLCNNKLEKLELNDYIIKVNFNISNSDFHNITNEISNKSGLPFNLVCNNFYETLKKCSHIIAHNISFDINVIKNELYRINRNDIIQEINKKKLICTMYETKNIMNIKKNPSLKELYKFATNNILENHHNSKYDVINFPILK